jgi:hypothetical protein
MTLTIAAFWCRRGPNTLFHITLGNTKAREPRPRVQVGVVVVNIDPSEAKGGRPEREGLQRDAEE